MTFLEVGRREGRETERKDRVILPYAGYEGPNFTKEIKNKSRILPYTGNDSLVLP